MTGKSIPGTLVEKELRHKSVNKSKRIKIVLLRISVFFLFSICLGLPAGAAPGQAPTTQQQLQAIYNKINAAAAQKNVDGVFDYDSADHTTTDIKGRIHEASDGRQELQNVMDTMDTVKSTTIIRSITSTETDATVVVKDHFIFTISNRSTGRTAKIVGDDVSRDYWLKTDEGWRRKKTRILSGKTGVRKNF